MKNMFKSSARETLSPRKPIFNYPGSSLIAGVGAWTLMAAVFGLPHTPGSAIGMTAVGNVVVFLTESGLTILMRPPVVRVLQNDKELMNFTLRPQ